ncbi:MAG: TRAP transporter small permease [Deltaproteobacteria bacterium]|nr:TRAP transporter small permease [Deltaproteobacteria bacterium]
MTGSQNNSAAYRMLSRFNRWLEVVETGLLILAGAAITSMMAITSVDVIMRYVFNSPLRWAYDFIILYILNTTFFCAFAYTLGHHGHISVEFLSAKLSRPLFHLLNGFGFAAVTVLFLIVTYTTATESFEAWENKDVISGIILWPVWPSKAIVPLGMLLLAMRTTYFALAHWICIKAKDTEGLI